MTKRPSPFETNIYRQSKVHLSDFENDSAALREIEERTLKKLIEGSRKCWSMDLNRNVEMQPAAQDTRNYNQKCVTNYFTVNGKKTKESVRKMIHPSEIVSRCFFCEAKTGPTYECVRCLEFYCSTCSFVNYESFEDNRICLSCS